MLINFCQDNLQTTITSDTISTEGHEVTNLLKNNDKGFLAYSAIKPPVNIDITFTCWIKISKVIIWPAVGGQKSSGFRLSARSTANNDYSQISMGFLTEKNEHGFLFYRNNNNNCNNSILNNFHSVIINASNHNNRMLDRVKSLRVGIIKTQNSVPAIMRIEIWGELSSFNNHQISKKILHLVNAPLDKRDHNNVDNLSRKILEDDVQVDTEKIKKNDGSTLEIPEEFLDPISCVIMQQPVVLPSGKIIDQSTLENYEKNEALWGRKLSDPFTGVSFTETNKPIFAASLKAQIDKFLSDNCDAEEVRAMPRVLGRLNDKKKDLNLALNKRKCPEENSQSVSKFKKPDTPREFSSPRRVQVNKSKKINVTSPSSSKRTATNENNFQIDENLEDNLKNILSRLKKFSGERPEPEKSESRENSVNHLCNCCENATLYKFPCNHVICRNKLLSNQKITCSDCGRMYNSMDIEKINI